MTGWVPSFSFLEIVTQKVCLYCFIRVLNVSLRLILITNGSLYPLRLYSLITEFSVFMLFQDITSGYSWLGGHSFEELQNYMENKSEGNESKIILGNFNCTMDKVDRNGGNKTQRVYRCGSYYALSKLIVDNGLEDLWRRENPDCSEFSRYDRSSVTRSRLDRVFTDIKIADKTKINHIMVFFTDHYNATSLDKFLSKTKIGND